MKTLKKVLALVLVAALTAGISIGATVAYLKDDDSDVNVMTLGNVQIEQVEQERDENGNLVDFTQAKPAYPAVGSENWSRDLVVNGTTCSMLNINNVVDKIVTVNNTGMSDAYVRTIFAIEAPEGDPNNLIMINWNDAVYTPGSGIKRNTELVTEIDGVTYYIAEILYTEALAAGAKSAPSLLQVYLTSAATNQDCAKFGDTWEILVVSQAVQTAGFEDAQTALDTAFGKTSEKAAEWFGGVAENVYINKVFSQNFDATQKVEIDGEGKEIFSYIDKELINWGEAGNKPNYANVFTNATVSNITFTGTMMPVMSGYWDGTCNFNNTFNNVNLVEIESVGNAAGFSPAMIIYGNATLNNCNIYGTTTKMEGTSLYDAMTQIGHTTINGGKIGTFYMANTGTTLTVNGAEMDSIYAAGRKAMIINIGEGSVIGTITLPQQATLTIAEGATVNTIICNGVTYTQAEWQAAQQ